MTGRYRAEAVGTATALLAGRCPSCTRVSFPLPDRCPSCGAQLDQIELGGPARLSVLTAVTSQPPGALVTAPYEVGVADFAEGIRVIGLIEGSVGQGDLVETVVISPYPDGETFAFRRVAADPPTSSR